MALARGTVGQEREERVARLPIDRAFLIAGFGPVVTGSLVSGTISKDQKLEVLPERRPVRVRRIEVHGREESVARSGERVSANLAGVELADLHRGLVLATPGTLPVTQRLHARLELLPTAAPIKEREPRVASPLRHRDPCVGARPRRPRGCSGRLCPRRASPDGSDRRDSGRPLRRASPLAGPDDRRWDRSRPASRAGQGAARRGEARSARSGRAGPLAERLLAWVEEGGDRGAGEEGSSRSARESRPRPSAPLWPSF